MLPGESQGVEQQRQRGSSAAVDAAQQGDVLARRRRRLALRELGVEPTDGAVLDEVGQQRRVAAQQLDGFTPSRQRPRRRPDVRSRRPPWRCRCVAVRCSVVWTTDFITCTVD